MYAADVIGKQRMDPKELVKKRYELHHSISDRRVSREDFLELMYPSELILISREQDIADYIRIHNRTLYKKGLQYYEKPILRVFESKEYTAPNAWAHTIPERKVIVMLPPELRDYNLPIKKHEVIHNVFPEASEGFVHSAAFNPSYDIVMKRFYLDYR